LFAPLFLLIACLSACGGGVQNYTKQVDVKVDDTPSAATVSQKRWYLENDHARLGLIDDPGGAIVEYVNKATGTDHVAGRVCKTEVDGKVAKQVGWGWINTIYDNATDPIEKQMQYQPFIVENFDLTNGVRGIKVVGQTAEQRIERWHSLSPGSAEVVIRIRLTNISDKPRRLWIRWHPYLFASADVDGKSGCVFSPGADDEVRKIRIGWGWDHWFRTHDGFWLAADTGTGEGLFTTFEKEKVPIHFTWTQYTSKKPGRGALTMEPFPEPILAEPGQSIESSFSYCPFTAETAAEDLPLGVLTDAGEKERARRFLRRIKPLQHLGMLDSYTLAQTIQFNWNHRRRDLAALRDWGFADCAIVGFPSQELPLRVRMIGGVFDEALAIEKFPVGWCQLAFNITATNPDGTVIFRHQESYQLFPGVQGRNRIDREIAIPMTGTPDGTYTLRVEAVDPLTRKPFHVHTSEVEVFDRRLQAAGKALEEQVKTGPAERPFVTALRGQQAELKDGRAVVPVGVEDGSGTVRKGFPVRLGVPFPQGAFPRDVPVRVLAPDGRTVAADLQPMNIWPDGSLKWLAASFAADCPADGFAFYRLEAGKGVPAAAAATALAVETVEAIEINTGRLKIRIPLGRLAIPGEVFLDADGNGAFDAGEQVMLASQDADVWWEDAKGIRYGMTLDGPAFNGVVPGVVLERNGAESAVVRITGWYTDGQGKRVALGEVRIEVFRGQAFFKLWHQVTFTGSPWHDRLASYGLKLRLRPGVYGKTVFDVDGADRAAGTNGTLYQRAYDRIDLLTEQGTAGGQSSRGAVQLAGVGGSVLFYHDQFREMFPKKLEADAARGELTVHYWPREAGVKDFAPMEEYWIPSSSSAEACGTGLSRTDEMVVDFSGAVTPGRAQAVYGEPVVACTPPVWVQQTAVLGNLHPCDPGRYPEVETFVGELTDFYQRNREFFKWYGHWANGTLHNVFQIPLYRWLEVGRYANIGNEEDIVQAPWLMYFRSGDRRHLKSAMTWTRYLMEVQSIRWHDLYPEWIGMSRRHHQTPWLGGGDWGHTMLCPYLEYYHATGYEPAWDMAKRTAASMQNTYAGSEWRYLSNPLIGNIRMYLETGEAAYKQQADRMWNDLCSGGRGDWWVGSHGSRMACWYAPLNEACMREWKLWSTEGRPEGGKQIREFQYMDTFGALGDQTGDDRFAYEALLAFDLEARGGKTGQLAGVHPLYRGMPLMLTQHALGNQRSVVYAAGQIAKARTLFPAAFINGTVKEVVVQDAEGKGFTLWLARRASSELKVTGPDGKSVAAAITSLYAQPGGLELLKLTVPAGGGKGCYRLPVLLLPYLGCSLKTVAILVDGRFNFPGSDPLYVRRADLGGNSIRVLMDGAPASSLELFGGGGSRLFSRTTVRPAGDAVAREHVIAIPEAEPVLKVGDKTGVFFPDAAVIPLYLNPDAIFAMP
jgi:hypothetical protein